tara:strand:+ start:467 stop:1252 length:786 start_codon:yes stop_codon:yes gene_type:complete
MKVYMSDKKLTFEDNDTITIKKVNNGFIIYQNDGTVEELPSTDLIETNGYPEEDQKGLVQLLYMVAGWAGFVDEESEEIDPNLNIGFGEGTPIIKNNSDKVIDIQNTEEAKLDEVEMSDEDIVNPTDIEQEGDMDSEQFMEDDFDDGDEYLDEFNAETPDLPGGSDALDGSVPMGGGERPQEKDGGGIRESDEDDSNYYNEDEPEYNSSDDGYNEDEDGDLPDDYHDDADMDDAEDWEDDTSGWDDEDDFGEIEEEGNGYD